MQPSEQVQVLLSTFNGVKHLGMLLDSLITQRYPCLEILVRDDGSSDGTLDVLNDYASSVTLTIGKRLGPTGSFLELLRSSSPDAGFVAFCDQDDVWMPDKVSRAVSALKAAQDGQPLLYCSSVVFVDENLRPRFTSMFPRRGFSFSNALVENALYGPTVMLNAEARALLQRGDPNPALLRMHDAWMYVAVTAFGRVIYDSQPSMLYRQHSANVIGVRSGSWPARWSRIARRPKRHTTHALEFERVYGDILPSKPLHILRRFLENQRTIVKRFVYALSPDTYRQSTVDDVLMRVLYFLNRY